MTARSDRAQRGDEDRGLRNSSATLARFSLSVIDGFVRRGAGAVSMEVSSHGLAQHRLAGIEFDVALLTNVSRDHLDYHGTMRRYRAAKVRLVRSPTLKYAVLNLDDKFGAEMVHRARHSNTSVVGYGFVVAGKGHEQHQEVRGIKHVFSDAAVVAAALREGRG